MFVHLSGRANVHYTLTHLNFASSKTLTNFAHKIAFAIRQYNLWRDFVPILTRCENRYAVVIDYVILSKSKKGCVLLIVYKIAKRIPLLKLSFVEKRRLERPNVEIQAVTLVNTS